MHSVESRLLSAVIVLIFGLCAGSAGAQNADSLVTQARKAAFEQHSYAEAIRLASDALSFDRNNPELLVFLGRLHTWSKQPDSARNFFHTARAVNPGYADAVVALADLEFWDRNYDAALAIVQQGLTINPADQELLLRKARILYEKQDYRTALGVVDTLLRNNKGNVVARSLADRIRDHASKNRVGLKYDYIHFDRQFSAPWHYLSLDYTNQSKAGAITARINYANRFQSSGLQYEVETYPILSRRFYAYLNLAYSDEVGVFPKWKAGASLYANLPAAFEAELGVRYLHFSSDAFMYTAYAGKYIGSLLIGARTYMAPAANNLSESYSVIARYYYGGVDDYVSLSGGAGVSPDDRQTNVQLNNQYRLRTYRAEFIARKAIRHMHVLLLNASFTKQQYLPEVSGNQLQAGIGYIRRF